MVFCEVICNHQGRLAFPHLGFNKETYLHIKKKVKAFYNFYPKGRKYLTHSLNQIQAKTLLRLSALDLSSSTSVASRNLLV